MSSYGSRPSVGYLAAGMDGGSWSAPDEESVFRTLKSLEESLYQPDTRFDREYLENILAPDFIEFGSSGRVWTRGQIIRTPQVAIGVRLPLPEFGLQMVSEDVALVTYRSEMGLDYADAANRSSIWRRTVDGWQLVFHQATPTNRR